MYSLGLEHGRRVVRPGEEQRVHEHRGLRAIIIANNNNNNKTHDHIVISVSVSVSVVIIIVKY